MDVGAQRVALKALLGEVPGLRVHTGFMETVEIPTDGAAKAVAVLVPRDPFIDYPNAVNAVAGPAIVHWTVTFLASRVDLDGGVAALDRLLSTGNDGSAVDALIADRALAGAVHSMVVIEATEYGFTVIGETTLLKADLNLDITARRTSS